MKSEANSLRISPKKMNLVAGMIREKDAVVAMDTLRFTPKKAAKILYKAVKSAVSNAENNFKQDRDSLYIKEITVTKGVTLKRNVSISKGRVHPILKRGAHVQVTLGVRENVAAEPKATAKTKATAQPKVENDKATESKAKKPARTKKVKA
jgi:large subunit ribosomal protein L22